jgi:hypothetical protein
MHYIYMPYSHLFPPTLIPTPPGRTCSSLLFSDFVKEKGIKFLFV